MAIATTVKQRVVSGGEIFLALYNAQGQPTGDFEYLGLTNGFSVTIATEKIQSFGSETGLSALDDETLTRITRAGQIVCRQISLENLQKFIIGDISQIVQTATPVAGEVITVKGDRHYLLGKTPANPTGVRQVTAVTVNGSGGTPTYVLDADYTLDAEQGKIYIIPTSGGGSIPGGDIEVDYTPGAVTRDQLLSSALAEVTCELLFVARNAKGPNRNLLGTKVTLTGAGDLPLKTEDPAYVEVTWDLSFADPDTGAALYIDDVPV